MFKNEASVCFWMLDLVCSHLCSLRVCLTLEMTDWVLCFHSREVAEGAVIRSDRGMRREEEERR